MALAFTSRAGTAPVTAIFCRLGMRRRNRLARSVELLEGGHPRGLKHVSRTCNILAVAVDHQHEFICLQCRFVTQYGVSGNANRHQSTRKRTDTPDDHGALHAAEQHGGEWTQDHDMADDWNEQQRRTEEHSDQAAPERSILTEDPRPISGIEKAHDMFLGLVILAKDRDLLHVESATLQHFHRIFRLAVLIKKRHRDIRTMR